MVTQNSDFTTQIKEATANFKEKAKEAVHDASVAIGQLNSFAKGNAEALVESGKTIRTGVNGLAADYVADCRTSLDLLKADTKQLAAVGSPADLIKLQANIFGRNILLAMNGVSKNNDAVLNLAKEASAPIAARIALTAASLQNFG